MCPICKSKKFLPVLGTPYYKCTDCTVWYQDPFPPKVYLHQGEQVGFEMSDHDKEVNKNLADYVFGTLMNAIPGKVLDVGAKYSWIGKCLRELGCDVTAIDMIPEADGYGEQLGIKYVKFDIDEDRAKMVETLGKFDQIILCHVLEHIYFPFDAIANFRAMLKTGDKMWVRVPDSDADGIERDLTVPHFTIHPFIYNLASVQRIIEGKFKVAGTHLMRGQRDYVWEAL